MPLLAIDMIVRFALAMCQQHRLIEPHAVLLQLSYYFYAKGTLVINNRREILGFFFVT